MVAGVVSDYMRRHRLRPISFAEITDSARHGLITAAESRQIAEHLIEHPPRVTIGRSTGRGYPVRLKVRGRPAETVGFVSSTDSQPTRWYDVSQGNRHLQRSRVRAAADVLWRLGWLTRCPSGDFVPTILSPRPGFAPDIVRSKPHSRELPESPPGVDPPTLPDAHGIPGPERCWGLVKYDDGTVVDCTLRIGHRPEGCSHNGNPGVSRSIDPQEGHDGIPHP